MLRRYFINNPYNQKGGILAIQKIPASYLKRTEGSIVHPASL